MKKFYITTSIPYVNAPPHIGNALEFVQADVLARYHRISGEDVFFLTGTDEHGLKIVRKAEKENKKPKEFVNEISGKFRELTDVLDISNDDFIRTTDQKRHWPSVRKVWLELKEKGDVYKKKYKGLYCIGCESFVSEKDLVEGKCSIHKKKPEKVEEENYFFKLSKYAPRIKKIIKKDELKIIPQARKNEILSFIARGVEDMSISREKERVQWGIPFPDDNTQTLYVWVEALINYISALGYSENEKNFKKFWPADVHCVGKDIFRFHCLVWPAMLIALKLPLPKTIFVHGFITVSGQKMSKSLGNIVNPFELTGKYGADALRYYLLSEISPTEDGDFTYEKFKARYNGDLASGIGNLLARIRTMGEGMDFNGKVSKEVKQRSKRTENNYRKALKDFKFNEALKIIWDLIHFCDKYVDKEKPWEKKENSKRVLEEMLFALENIAELLKPFLPETSKRIFRETEKDKKGFKNPRGKILFPKIE